LTTTDLTDPTLDLIRIIPPPQRLWANDLPNVQPTLTPSPKGYDQQKADRWVCWISPSLPPGDVAKLTIFTSCKSFREKYTLNESHLPDYLCPTILYAKQHLGSGGTGSVFATSDPDDRLFVVKISQGAQRHLLLHESNIYRALALLDFKATFIPRYFGFFSHPDFDVIVMEHTGSAIQDINQLSVSDRSAHFS
jgi:hypothetical protein